ncbi:MAG: hypothetical protein U0835_10215 [Isosphaeraceae bacterium]
MQPDPRRTAPARAAAACLALSLVLAHAGCGSGEPGLVPVRGKVTLDGGPWPKEGTINFTPTSGEGGDPSKLRPGGGKFGTDGSFTVGSFEASDGLFPGTYQVSVDCPEAPPQMSPTGQAVEARNAVPKKFRDPSTSGLKVTVTAGGNTDLALDVKTK